MDQFTSDGFLVTDVVDSDNSTTSAALQNPQQGGSLWSSLAGQLLDVGGKTFQSTNQTNAALQQGKQNTKAQLAALQAANANQRSSMTTYFIVGGVVLAMLVVVGIIFKRGK